MHISPLLFLAGASIVAASPIADKNVLEKRAAPSVQIASGTIVGSSDITVDSFKGIPFAQPPVGNLRLRPPQPITQSLGTVNAVGVPKGCPQSNPLDSFNTSAIPGNILGQVLGNPLLQAATATSEDCLNLNVQKPSNATASSKLPVLVWFYGGGFEFGSTQIYDGSLIVKKSIALGAPIVFVAVNYRVGGFGFLAGKELQADGSTNLGLRDQRLGLQWVQDNIAAFGGDPTKVTIWGESAGAISVFDHTVINGGDNSYKDGKLFRAAIMNSGSIVPTKDVDSAKPQRIYDTVVAAAGCSSAANTLTCLRNLDYGKFYTATLSVPGIFSYRSLDLSYLPRPDPKDNFFSVSPEISINNGRFTKVPVIIGDQEDEGTLFSLTQFNTTTSEALVKYLLSYFPATPNAESLVRGLVATYPDDLGVSGSPFRTGVLYNIYPQFKRLAAILGDFAFTLTRRTYLSKISSQVPTWSYLSTFLYGTPLLGTAHGTDILYSFGYLGPNNPTNSFFQYYISFVNNLDPNSLKTGTPLINWPNWNTATRSLLNIQQLVNQIIPDNFREASYQYASGLVGQLRL